MANDICTSTISITMHLHLPGQDDLYDNEKSLEAACPRCHPSNYLCPLNITSRLQLAENSPASCLAVPVLELKVASILIHES